MKVIDLHTDVFAVKCVKDFLFFGVGCTLYMASSLNQKVLSKKRVLHPDNIHNIYVKSNNELIVFGGKSLAVVNYNKQDETGYLETGEVHKFDDWIINVKRLKCPGTSVVAILFAHNNVQIYDLDLKLISRVACTETCLLYAGMISGNVHETAAILGGTVFQEILIWNLKAEADQKYSEVLHRLKGHKGVIFSVSVCPMNHIICSTSDDRTVRLWSVSCSSATNEDINWKNVKIRLETTMYGHLARVWRAIIFKHFILSIGEDSRICTWSLSGQLLQKVDAHRGAAIWSIDVSENEVIYTGGADGSVNSWPFHRPDLKTVTETKISLEDVDNFTPKHVRFIDSDNLLIFSNEKNCSKMLFMKKTEHEQEMVCNLPNHVSNYCTLEICPSKSRLAVASISGEVTIYERLGNVWNSVKTHKIVDSKIFSLQWLTDDASLICADNGAIFLVKFLGDSMEIKSEHTLPPSRERWTTSACLYNNLIICGDRMGSIFVYALHSHSKDPVQTFRRIHGRLGVQSCITFDSKLVTTGRDGTLKCYEFCDVLNENPFIRFLYSKSMPMDWVGKLLPHKSDCYVIGFKEENFVVYSTRLKRLLMKVPCGGGHRSWDCLIHNNVICFVFIQRKCVHVIEASLNKLFLPPVLRGFHTKVIYCVQVLVIDSKKKILISGGEDCNLNISLLETPTGKPDQLMKNLDSFDGHLSNIKSVSIFQHSKNGEVDRNFIFSCGGRAQIKAWEITLGRNQSINPEDVTCIDLLSYMLHGPDKERSKIWYGKELMYNADPETRFMDMSVMTDPLIEDSVLMFVACSDGFLRILRYSIVSNEIKLLESVPYKNRCILKIHSFKHQGEILCMTMGTDGYLCFWSIRVEVEKLKVESISVDHREGHLLHQSGINSFDIQMLSDNYYLLASGGDDNLLSMVIFEITMDPMRKISIQVVSCWKTIEAHHAQISGVALVGNKLLSVGADQKLVTHEYLLENLTIDSVFLKEETLCISDIQGLTVVDNSISDNELFCVFGKGLQIVKNQFQST
ncbi:hypothetical protein QAD02_006856 [Eretmocerus hayati]|uniref:Uncharacterized protein n=1 Tax=Eretmocerus hayati TaxID=131215 RepID=A0ACC2N4F7_9HYME|nr:hypothetical protein QAD02_006856 [Eretmocerus hayati]